MKRCAYALSILLAFFNFVYATCYFPDGSSVQDTPCNTGSTNSTCCSLGYACLSNHICALTDQVPADSAKSSPPFVRASCTDRSWTSPECPSLCLNSTNGDNLGLMGMGMKRCDAGGKTNRFYCSNKLLAEISEKDVCANSSYYIEFPEAPRTVTIIDNIPTSSPSTSAISSSAPQDTASTIPTTAPSTPSTANAKDTRSAWVSLGLGLGIGLGLGVPFLICIAAFMFYRQRRHARGPPVPVKDIFMYSTNTGTTIPTSAGHCELSAPLPTVHEVESKTFYELAASRGKEIVSCTELASPQEGTGEVRLPKWK
ncbi:hypothetical protein DM02DRAFT_651136 [Periconia macrospinosa]|uniref:Mid2 domain-containing protein n=1 Tax=Periconia macrospinosa TaxID=97972 RepID=A0A2V1E6P5_9PLEO|nr:hypothetical protein DM02DRAFT_651136 [Periconia macrospinosa]